MALRANPEEEMLKLRERYQKSRAQQKGIKPEVKETLKKETSNSGIVVEKKKSALKKVKKQNPYIRLIKHDLENLYKLFKRIMGLKIRREEKEKPLDLSWIEKNSGKLF